MTEQEFHNSRIAFYVDLGCDKEVRIIPKGMSHKKYLGYRYGTVEALCARGYLKDRVLMLYQGADFAVPTADYDLEKILQALRITKSSLDYIGLGCKVGEIGEEWEPIEKIKIGPFKYISYMITIGGDAGWRFSNHSEWCSTEHTLLFDIEKWSMEDIAKEMKVLWRNYWSHGHGSTYAEKYDFGVDGVEQLLKKDGVYAFNVGFTSKTPEDKIISPEFGEIETWNINGQTTNYEYDK